MNYEETLEWLFTQTSVFEREGATAYKPGLQTITSLCEQMKIPYKELRTVHVAGTNGKGSTSSLLAAIFQSAGLRTGLFTSPHISDFRERIRVNGEMIPRDEVVSFVERYQLEVRGLTPSFFELTTAMGFDWFARQGVDIAVIEVGLGGRLDSTNIITPEVSVITNISLDHTALLGNTLAEVATEKAGIIKPGVPVVIGEAEQAEVREVFEAAVRKNGSTISFARPLQGVKSPSGGWDFPDEGIHLELDGEFQLRNMATVLDVMRYFPEISREAIAAGAANVCTLTGLRGRMSRTQLPDGRTLIFDTGHNPGAWVYTSRFIAETPDLTAVIGFAADKDVDAILRMLPVEGHYIFTAPATPRALPAEELQRKAAAVGLEGPIAETPAEAIHMAATGAILLAGSNYFGQNFPESSTKERSSAE
ncbi:MAG: bifunctional folylpolyglutamate synthase/dihydrofolate synthase [Muribaculaceae bacterium]|nr:bifunctional folylpolyglutamate synthase/dihydrofolate synthase [Muribaculaceae bacterium]